MTAPETAPTPPSGDSDCAGCGKPAALCVCAAMAPVANRVHVLVLRHPQEQDKLLGTAGILTRQLERATLRTGLSWPNLSRALGADADPRRWGALYLGTAKQAPPRGLGPLVAVDGEGAPMAEQSAALEGIDGIVLLDGNWSQAKALWWRNAWLLKCRRFIVNPESPSLYGALRREPRRESVSTLEAGALALAALERRPELVEAMMAPFRLLLRKYRAAGFAPRPPDRRRRRRGA
ncbi:MAG: DTW domain-containing protein [Rhodospirillales bacterium]|nr:MAG: DTW domain-containing protein [Rhodospirillales bacterium]